MPALEGMRILDMTQYEAGTSATQLLAWLGADVVKVEQPRVGDPGRGVAYGTETSQYFMNYNSNKRSVAIDVGTERGRDLLLGLAPRFHAFVENYGPGVMERLRLDYDAMREAHPGIIYGRIKGFGLSGPYSEYKSYDWVAQAAGGAFSVTGEADGPPMRVGPTYADSGTGVQMALALTAAYVQQQRTGKGQLIEISMQEAVTLFMRTLGLLAWGEQPAPRQGGSQGVPPTGTYRCKGDGPNDYVFIMCTTTRMWDSFCTAIGNPALTTDERFAEGLARFGHADELRALVGEWTRQHSKWEVMELLGEAGVPCSAVYETTDLFNDRHLKERDFIQTVEHPTAGTVRLMRNPIRMSESELPITPSPLLGEHTEQVLCGDLGLSAGELEDLRGAGVVA